MATMTQKTSDDSVRISLAELAKIEAERLREEDGKRARAREAQARALREAEERRRAAQAEAEAAEAEARTRRDREDAAEKARIEARERAAIEVARIEAEAKARLDADNALRAHELSVLRVRTDSRHRRLVRALAVALGLMLAGGAAAAIGGTRHVATLEQGMAELRAEHLALSREREHGRTTELAVLDRRHAALRARLGGRAAGEALVTAEAARHALDARSLDHGRLRAFGDALDTLEARIDALDRLAALDRRHADLAAWASERRRSDVMAAAESAAARAKGDNAGEGALRAYEDTLDQLRGALARVPRGKGLATSTAVENTGGECLQGDPGCGLDGKRVF